MTRRTPDPKVGVTGVLQSAGLPNTTISAATDNTAAAKPFQLLPPLSEQEYAALRADIAARGVLVPVVVDQHGRILDGHHRQRIAADLGVECPSVVRHVDNDEDAADLAVTMNAARRHLSREQRRDLIEAEIVRRPDDSDRAIARRVGCDHKTVGAARRELSGEIPHPDDEAESEIGDVAAEVGLADVQKFAEALGDPAIAAALANSPAVRDMIHNGIKGSPELAQEARKALDELYEERPKPVKLPGRHDSEKPMDLLYEFVRLHAGVKRLVDLVTEGKAVVADAQRDALLSGVQWLRTALNYIESGIRAEGFDVEVAKLLRGES